MNNKSYPIQIRFSDIDTMGIVHNAVYLQYFEQARLFFFKELAGTDWDWVSHGVIVARNEVDYLIPVFLQDEINVEIFCVSIGNSSFCLGYKVWAKNSTGNLLKAKGQSIMVCYNHATKAKMPVFDKWKELLLVHNEHL